VFAGAALATAGLVVELGVVELGRRDDCGDVDLTGGVVFAVARTSPVPCKTTPRLGPALRAGRPRSCGCYEPTSLAVALAERVAR